MAFPREPRWKEDEEGGTLMFLICVTEGSWGWPASHCSLCSQWIGEL